MTHVHFGGHAFERRQRQAPSCAEEERGPIRLTSGPQGGGLHMLLLKTDSASLPGVLEHSKHASDTVPDARIGDEVLIALTRGSIPPHTKSIRYHGVFQGVHLDTARDTERIWGRPWQYVIELSDLQPVAIPFNIEEVQVSRHNYRPIVTHARLTGVDERAVRAYL
jgi:hypothetical protein